MHLTIADRSEATEPMDAEEVKVLFPIAFDSWKKQLMMRQVFGVDHDNVLWVFSTANSLARNVDDIQWYCHLWDSEAGIWRQYDRDWN